MHKQDVYKHCFKLFVVVVKSMWFYGFDYVLSFIVLNATMTQLKACLCLRYNVLAEAICPRLFVVVYNCVLWLFIIVVVECKFIASFIFISVSIGQLKV